MKMVMLLVYIFYFASMADASYLRTIRIASYPNEEKAKEALKHLQLFVQKHPNIIKLQEEWDFEFKERASGKYFITLAEPFRDRKVLQEVLDTLRLEYKDVYVTRLQTTKKPAPKKLKHATPLVKTEAQQPIEPKIIPTVMVQEEKKEKQIPSTLKKIEPVYKTHIHQTPVQTLQEEETQTYQVLFFIALAIVGALLLLIFYYKRKEIVAQNKALVIEQKYENIFHEMQNKEKLISYVSHELRSPMTAIMGLTNLVLESNLTKLQRDYVEKIEKSSNYMLSLLNDILDMSKIQAGKMTIENTEFNINDIVNYVYNIVSIQAKHNNITISVDVEKDVPSHVVGDSLRLGQVLINLLSNAVKFTRNGDVSLRVKKVESYGDNVRIEFSVSDTGIGMTQEQVQKLFSSYYQAESSTSREFGGTGLGLSISKNLVELMQGEIHVKSKKGIGTTFVFSIPFALRDSQNKRQYRLPTAKLLNKNILIVDAHNKNAIPLMQAMHYFKYTTHNIISFEQAPRTLLDTKYDIIIINLHNLNQHAIERIKEFKEKYGTKVVIFSELHSSLNDSLLDELVIDGYLRPPVTIQSVLNMVTDLYVQKHSIAPKKKDDLKLKMQRFKGKKILLAEDNELNHKVINGMLANTGIEVTCVEDGQKVLELLQSGTHIDLVLMDINMPVLNGYETARAIRSHTEFASIPILALSADVSADAVRRSFKNGMQGHIGKPISMDEFYSKIIEIFSEKKMPLRMEVEEQEEQTQMSDEELSPEMGLVRYHNDKDKYKSQLKDFQMLYADAATQLYKLCKNAECKKARHLAMDIKDMALNIGAYKLGEAAASMEYEFEKGTRGNYKEQIQAFHASLKKLFIAIDRYLQAKD